MGGRTWWTNKSVLAIIAAVHVTISVVACGGTVREDEEEPPAGQDPSADHTADPQGGGGGSDDTAGSEVELPECKLGVKRSEAERCIFLYEGRCYESKLDACGCACKKQSGTTCSSGFPSDTEPTEVTCR